MTSIQELNIERLIAKSEEKTYFEIPFKVPENVSKLEVSYSYKRRSISESETGDIFNKEINVVDIAIMDESKSFRGWSGSERLYFYITENEATPGYVRGIINEGEWAIILGAYKIQEEGCIVNVNIKFTPKERVLLKGDLHIHSIHSDGKYDVSDVINLAKLHGMDFIFLTDHNTFSQCDGIVTSDSLVVLPGMEWTHYNGHCNFLGVKNPIKNFVSNDKDKTVEIMKEAKAKGALITLNHPYCQNCGWKWGFDVPFDAVEVWNGPIKKSEYDAVQWWNSKLIAGERIPIVGGSDSHKNELFRMIGTPTTFLYSNSRGQSDIIKAIKNGHAFVSYTANGPIIEFSVGDAIMGDCIDLKENQTGLVKVQNVGFKDEIKLISDKGIEKMYSIHDENTKTFSFHIEERVFYRVEVWREIIPHMTALVSVSNPIYIRL
ncbi:CehA/McbA family metallohydrolase [Clostridium sp. DJ247]|uniref:CehA/McbA family metallohydrolase n=1 Tax=Clostridium sp. DJ247 TaxID=2726188 RepID=UPI00162349BD|nr:CehA/McbA family metallohydrolase [Clostridium sp. DJ247]MBC2582304.1 CehA/McbA family metallohydrolase [Clostridium sp. DJ247]